MRCRLTCFVSILVTLFAASADAGQIWTDGNGDGLPDTGGPLEPQLERDGRRLDRCAVVQLDELPRVHRMVGRLHQLRQRFVRDLGRIELPDRQLLASSRDRVRRLRLHTGRRGPHRQRHSAHQLACQLLRDADHRRLQPVLRVLAARRGLGVQLFTTNPGTCYGTAAAGTRRMLLQDCSCQDLVAAECDAAGGTPQGAGTTCATANCPPPPPGAEACCFTDGSCQELVAADCEAAGGTPQGEGTTCATANCPPPPPEAEACCFTDGSCQDLVAADCDAAGGTPQGAGSECATANCPPPPPEAEACCFTDGSCQDLVAADCDTAGGTPQGEGTTCATANCPPPPPEAEACCFTDGSCRVCLAADCSAAGGTPQGAGSKSARRRTAHRHRPRPRHAASRMDRARISSRPTATLLAERRRARVASARRRTAHRRAFGAEACCFTDGSCQELVAGRLRRCRRNAAG